MSWIDDLEARLDSQLQDFLRTNPAQEALLAEQERRDRQERLRRQRLQLQEEAERSRAALLQLASEIRSWQERVARARSAGADDLAVRAEAHVAGLMEQGRQRWQGLAELGQRFSAVEWELSELSRQKQGANQATGPSATADRQAQAEGAGARGATNGTDGDLGEAWAAFEAQQELETLKQRLQR
jgi:hercynine metabolism protein